MFTNGTITSDYQYRCLTRNVPHLSREEEADIVQKARAGDKAAREQVITNCLTYIEFIAKRYERYLHHDDYLDLVSIGTLAVVENVNTALVKDNPSGWLRSRGKYAILNYCITRAGLITRPDRSPPISTVSLDKPIFENKTLVDVIKAEECPRNGERPDYTFLYQALEELPRAYREVISRHYGLYGYSPESLYELSRRMSKNVKGSIAYLTEYRALKRLRKHLSHQERRRSSWVSPR